MRPKDNCQGLSRLTRLGIDSSAETITKNQPKHVKTLGASVERLS
jgi:hypothetical protein